jgi:hypothetical protein
MLWEVGPSYYSSSYTIDSFTFDWCFGDEKAALLKGGLFIGAEVDRFFNYSWSLLGRTVI